MAPGSSIVPGEVNRTSIKLEATYDPVVDLGFNDRSLVVDVKITLANRSGAGIDRVELLNALINALVGGDKWCHVVRRNIARFHRAMPGPVQRRSS